MHSVDEFSTHILNIALYCLSAKHGEVVKVLD